ncbi:MAG: response regulator transcription factor [Anaerolineales bacterium]
MKGKILVVDDEPTARRSWREILRLEGYHVETAAEGKAALEILRNQAFDVILLDLKMPGMSGVEVLQTVSKTYPDIQVIVLTAHGSLDSAIEALRQGAHDYLLKPASTEDVLSSVADALAVRSELQHRRLLLGQIESSLHQLKNSEGLEADVAVNAQVISMGKGIMMDMARREIWRGSDKVVLTPTEGKLMQVLWENRGRVMTHRELVLMVQGYETSEWEAPEVLRPLVSRLRRKLAMFPGGSEWIVNVRGTGYVFEGVG